MQLTFDFLDPKKSDSQKSYKILDGKLICVGKELGFQELESMIGKSVLMKCGDDYYVVTISQYEKDYNDVYKKRDNVEPFNDFLRREKYYISHSTYYCLQCGMTASLVADYYEPIGKYDRVKFTYDKYKSGTCDEIECANSRYNFHNEPDKSFFELIEWR